MSNGKKFDPLAFEQWVWDRVFHRDAQPTFGSGTIGVPLGSGGVATLPHNGWEDNAGFSDGNGLTGRNDPMPQVDGRSHPDEHSTLPNPPGWVNKDPKPMPQAPTHQSQQNGGYDAYPAALGKSPAATHTKTSPAVAAVAASLFARLKFGVGATPGVHEARFEKPNAAELHSEAWSAYTNGLRGFEGNLTPDQRVIFGHYADQQRLFDKFSRAYATQAGPNQEMNKTRPDLPSLDWNDIAQWARSRGYTDRAIGPNPPAPVATPTPAPRPTVVNAAPAVHGTPV